MLYRPNLNTRNTLTRRIARSTAKPLPPPLTASSRYHGSTATTSTWFIGFLSHVSTPCTYVSSPFTGPDLGWHASLDAISTVNRTMQIVSVTLNGLAPAASACLSHSGTVSRMNPIVAMKIKATTA